MSVAVHKAADYYEPLFRARVMRAMKAVRAAVSINHLAMSMGNAHQAASAVPRKEIEAALQPASRVITDAFNQGGKIGAEKVKKVLS